MTTRATARSAKDLGEPPTGRASRALSDPSPQTMPTHRPIRPTTPKTNGRVKHPG
jgi:hypothetical protein